MILSAVQMLCAVVLFATSLRRSLIYRRTCLPLAVFFAIFSVLTALLARGLLSTQAFIVVLCADYVGLAIAMWRAWLFNLRDPSTQAVMTTLHRELEQRIGRQPTDPPDDK